MEYHYPAGAVLLHRSAAAPLTAPDGGVEWYAATAAVAAVPAALVVARHHAEKATAPAVAQSIANQRVPARVLPIGLLRPLLPVAFGFGFGLRTSSVGALSLRFVALCLVSLVAPALPLRTRLRC